jgi:anti-sigma regulatory factor (Ser/Thr protein kinase)
MGADGSVRGVRRSAAPEFRHTFPAVPEELAPLRRLLRQWLRKICIREDLASATVLSVSEAAANSIEHGLGFDERGTVTVVGVLRENGLVELFVGDDGVWREPRGRENRGYGLRIIDAVMDDVGIERHTSGTLVRMGLWPSADSRARRVRPA